MGGGACGSPSVLGREKLARMVARWRLPPIGETPGRGVPIPRRRGRFEQVRTGSRGLLERDNDRRLAQVGPVAAYLDPPRLALGRQRAGHHDDHRQNPKPKTRCAACMGRLRKSQDPPWRDVACSRNRYVVTLTECHLLQAVTPASASGRTGDSRVLRQPGCPRTASARRSGRSFGTSKRRCGCGARRRRARRGALAGYT